MRLAPVRLVAASLLSLPLLALPACDDADAATRTEVAHSLIKAADDAFLAGSDSAALEKVARTLKGLKGGTPQQDATRDRMLSSIQLHLATIEITKIEIMDVSIRHDLLRLRAMVDVAAQMSVFAAARENLEDSGNVTQLAERREQIRSQVEKVRLQSDQLNAPVIATVESLEAASEDVLRLRRQANRFREEAGMASQMQRFPIIEQAIELERQADRIEAEMMRKELSLEIIHRPAKSMLDQSQADLEGMLTEIDEAQNSLQEIARQTTQSATQAREALHDMDAKLSTLSKDIADQVTGNLRTSYDKAHGLLRQAQANARKSGRHGVGRLAKQEQSLLQARIELAQADLGLLQIRGLDEWIRVLDQLAKNVDLGNRDAWRLQAEEARKQRSTLAQKATQDIDAALSSSARSPTSDATRTHLSSAKNYLSTPPADTTSSNDDTERTASEPETPDQSDLQAAASDTSSEDPSTAQGLIDATKAAMQSGDLKTMVAFQDANTYFKNSDDSAEAKATTQVTLGLVAIKKAAQSAFGGTIKGASGMLIQSAEMMAMAANATFSNVTENGNTGSATFSMMGMDQPVPLVKVDGRWWFDGDDEVGMSGAKIIGAASIQSQVKNILEQVESGAISDQAQLDKAMEPINKVIQEAMTKMRGG
ncbi:MAG: hypothetical protein VX527_00750 [Planctomycetota bacterium]|nr:hypothetical protein [Planctomycetota bacterium]